MITRYAYRDTLSEAGSPNYYKIDPKTVTHAYVWLNSYGNPTYTLYTDEAFYMCVDDYGAMNNINHISAQTVQRKKDL